MKKIILISIFLTLGLNNLLIANEKKCGTFDLGCKAKKYMDDTKKFQKDGLSKSKNQLKKTKNKVIAPLKK